MTETISVKPVSIRILTIDNKKNFSLNLFKQLPFASLDIIYDSGCFAKSFEVWGKCKLSDLYYVIGSSNGILYKFGDHAVQDSINSTQGLYDSFELLLYKYNLMLSGFSYMKEITYYDVARYMEKNSDDSSEYWKRLIIKTLNDLNIAFDDVWNRNSFIPSENILKILDFIVNNIKATKLKLAEKKSLMLEYQAFLEKCDNLPQLFIGS